VAVADPKPNDWYFAYGSNMQEATFLERRRMQPLDVVAGRPVTKNVAGYDLVRLVCGCGGTLADVQAVTLQLRPAGHVVEGNDTVPGAMWPVPEPYRRALIDLFAEGRRV